MKIHEYEDYLVKVSKEIMKYLIKMGLSEADAKDISQDVFVKLLELDTVIPYDKLRAWMYQVAIRTSIDKHRRRQTYDRILQERYLSLESWQLEQTEPDDLLQALEGLTSYEQTILMMKYDQQFQIKEMALILNLSEGKIKTDLYRARQTLKQQLKEK
ncbi:RNA polymerase sigma factor [Vagococcus humatus]|uniref:RNA polymerase subunit sigma-70 n=1 Tax=Vagococcus humatus TaxID=1889241 RepID=A0A429Z8T9_9ENTE|nr:RNA polymerase sigma factor [Vagococcus humatus]RST90101.1 hypothetical protein C7P63_03205 [Vagococcus humatus]